MSRSSNEDDAGSDRSDLSYMSLPGTPTADGEATFWGGELSHGYLTFCGLCLQR